MSVEDDLRDEMDGSTGFNKPLTLEVRMRMAERRLAQGALTFVRYDEQIKHMKESHADLREVMDKMSSRLFSVGIIILVNLAAAIGSLVMSILHK